MREKGFPKQGLDGEALTVHGLSAGDGIIKIPEMPEVHLRYHGFQPTPEVGIFFMEPTDAGNEPAGGERLPIPAAMAW